MKRTCLPSFSASCGLCLVAGEAPAQAATVTLNPTAETFVYEDLPNANYGAGSLLIVERNEFLKEYLALVRFDLSSIPPIARQSVPDRS